MNCYLVAFINVPSLTLNDFLVGLPPIDRNCFSQKRSYTVSDENLFF